MGEYSLNARIESAIEGQEGLPTVLDICRRHDSGKWIISQPIDFVLFNLSYTKKNFISPEFQL